MRAAVTRYLLVTLCLCTWPPAVAVAGSGDIPEDEAGAWDVSNPDFSVAAVDASINVTSGTWMSVDVSPDGRTIALDLLGDIYVLPIDGGEARNISAGAHWDMQPQFSPDGSQLAFTSDRSGGDNIWIMDTDGGNPRALTSETFQLPNSPAWSPDGTYIAARKHFATQRSLGAGEVWLYHVAGGKGVPAVERPDPKFQKELGEPVFLPDGSGVYFTQNTTPGNSFVYAQDSNRETFRIKRLTFATGEVHDIAGGPGGAVRPTPSPDGQLLAFVRRVRAQSRLFVRELATGTERMLVDRLDQDMQESWAIHGLYPTMSFTPDSASVVYWAGGGLHRVDVATGSSRSIPFSVRDERRTWPAPRPQVTVAPERFETRMPRWAQQLPGSNAVVFETLGRLWIKRGTAAPQRLTRADDNRDDSRNGKLEKQGFELFPTVSRDGRWVYFVRWHDQRLGQLFRVATASGRTQALSDVPGHYRELAVSPDGGTLVVRRSQALRLLDDRYGGEPGIYQLPGRGGPLTLVTRDGQAPQFGADNNRLFVVRTHGEAEDGGSPPRKLVEIDLDGGRARDIAGVQFPTEMAISPDGRQLAFVAGYQAWLTPLPRTGKLIELGPKADNLPVRRVSAVGATFIHWPDVETLAWSIGPDYRQVQVARALEAEFEPSQAGGVNLSVDVASDRAKGRLALTGARIVTMDAAGVIERGTVLIDGNRIAAVGADVAIPADATVVAVDGQTIVPGFIDAHAHGPYAEELIVPQQNWSVLGHLALGVTTVHDPSSEATSVFAAAEYARAGRIVAPRIFSTGEIIYGAKSYRWAPIESLDDALAHVRRLKAQGAISVKNYNQPRRSQRQQVVEAARREQLAVVAEGGSLYHMDLSLVADGNTGVEHSLPQMAIYDDVVQFWSQTNVGYTPTLVVGYGTLWGENYWYQHTEVWKHSLLSRWVPPRLLQARAVRGSRAPDVDYGQADNAAIGKRLADAGVLVNTGAHGQREGLATHWEMWMFVQGGMTPLDALRAATSAPAEYLGLDADLGSITPGKLADLVIIDGDVTRDIRLSDRVTRVVHNGRLRSADTLAQQWPQQRELAPLYWQGRPESAIR